MSWLTQWERKAKKAVIGAERDVGAHLIGRRNLGVIGLGTKSRTPSDPFAPGDPRAPKPGDFPIITTPGGGAVCGGSAYNSRYGAGQPFALVGFKSLGAGAQTQGTDLIDFHAATSNPTVIASDDLIPGNVEIFELSTALSPRLTVTLGFEGIGFLAQIWIIEYVNGIEKARWSMTDLALMIGAVGQLTNGAAGYAKELSLPNIAWHRKYDPNVKVKTAAQISVTTTTVSALDASFLETGIRP